MRFITGGLLAFLSVIPSVAVCGPASSPSTPGQSLEEKAVQIVLHPAAEPRPALKYRLLPPFMERRPRATRPVVEPAAGGKKQFLQRV